jgi:hypothetical protein
MIDRSLLYHPARHYHVERLVMQGQCHGRLATILAIDDYRLYRICRDG